MEHSFLMSHRRILQRRTYSMLNFTSVWSPTHSGKFLGTERLQTIERDKKNIVELKTIYFENSDYTSKLTSTTWLFLVQIVESGQQTSTGIFASILGLLHWIDQRFSKGNFRFTHLNLHTVFALDALKEIFVSLVSSLMTKARYLPVHRCPAEVLPYPWQSILCCLHRRRYETSDLPEWIFRWTIVRYARLSHTQLPGESCSEFLYIIGRLTFDRHRNDRIRDEDWFLNEFHKTKVQNDQRVSQPTTLIW